ncbi:peptidase C39 [Massilia sp. Root418]|jgi:predicted double-glycine peptidase|uniref:C39 family peptidase n=1 Tax=Massilia sp. Root418 TaxID=1736532 RepID=UPI0007008184|nr:C39 family peptidase [Massilia sp. Root418]KQW96818.1 peptidase C39 [Massilia sp. Root418]
MSALLALLVWLLCPLLLALPGTLRPCAAAEVPGLGGAGMTVRVTSLKEARFSSTIRQQFDFSCGSAALATMLTYHYGYALTEQQAFEEMYRHGDQQKIRREGFSLLDIKRFLERRDFRADGFALPLEKLREEGFPAIVLLEENGYHHFVVVKGVDESRVLIGDPAGGTRAMSRARFEALWRSKLLFVIHAAPRQAQFNAPSEWRLAPRALLGGAVPRESLSTLTMPKHGLGDH